MTSELAPAPADADWGFWTNYFRQAIRELQGFRVGALEKVVPAFEGIAEDAERAIEAEYERLGSMTAYDAQIDMSDVADMAMEHRTPSTKPCSVSGREC